MALGLCCTYLSVTHQLAPKDNQLIGGRAKNKRASMCNNYAISHTQPNKHDAINLMPDLKSVGLHARVLSLLVPQYGESSLWERMESLTHVSCVDPMNLLLAQDWFPVRMHPCMTNWSWYRGRQECECPQLAYVYQCLILQIGSVTGGERERERDSSYMFLVLSPDPKSSCNPQGQLFFLTHHYHRYKKIR